MLKRKFILLAGLFLSPQINFAQPLLETKDFVLSMDSYLRTDLVSYENVVDLDSSNRDDTTTYLGIDYSFAFGYTPKQRGVKAYLKLERNGPGDYSAPLFVHNTLMNSGGRIEKYHDEQFLPQLEEFWLDAPLGKTLGVKAGLYSYEVGYGFSLNGSFENFGVALYQETPDWAWRVYYCRPEVVYKNPMGPHIPQDPDQGYFYHPNASNFFAADVKIGKEENYLQPYVGALADYTSSGKRENIFSAPVKKEILGTGGIAWGLKKEGFFLEAEFARNFGRAASASLEFEDVIHSGYFAYLSSGKKLGKFTPRAQLLAASGNKVSPEMAANQDLTLSSGRNRAFSSYSPLNQNLGGSISAFNSQSRPVVAMGSGCGLHTGIPRPGTLASSDFEDLFISSLGIDIALTPKIEVTLDSYYLSAFCRPVGTLNGEGRYLSRELGYEADAIIDYKVNPHLVVSFLGGYFIPGRYYKEHRDDTSGSLLSSYVRGDGHADNAYQLELSMEVTF